MDVQKGIFFYEWVTGPDRTRRRPAFIFSSNNLEKADQLNPWLDVIDLNTGYALYHGDNRSPNTPPLDTRGNRHFVEVLRQYSDPALRALAPPILLLEHVMHAGRRKGHRRFCGYGIPTDVRVQAQATERGHFLNLTVELALLGLERESGLFPSRWIDDRRNSELGAHEANRAAPWAWRLWLAEGERALSKVRYNALRPRLVRATAQRQMTDLERAALTQVGDFYGSIPHGFEGLASWVTERVLGTRCVRGWVTKRSGDGGIDFVNRLDIGAGLSSTGLVVLGQAKLRQPAASINGEDVARVVARLRRGWVGAFVTTGVFSDNAQAEVIADEYPLLLINGKRLAEELIRETTKSAISVSDLAAREQRWYEENFSNLPPQYIVGWARGGQPLLPDPRP